MRGGMRLHSDVPFLENDWWAMIRIRRAAALSTIILAFGLALFVQHSARGQQMGQPANKYEISIQDFSFRPALLRVPIGSVVTWTNRDEEPHTVLSTDNAFKSRALDTNESFSFTFEKAGTYKYFCSVHPRMVGTVLVGTKEAAK